MRVLLPDGMSPTADPILEILKAYKTMAVVGLSSNPSRASYGVTEYMQSAGYRIIPVNPNETMVLGEKSYARLEDVPEKTEIVDVSTGGGRAACRRECDKDWRKSLMDAVGN